MGFLSDEERHNLQIGAMSLHVVGKGLFVPQQARPVEHEVFFVERILDTDVASAYEFKEVSASRDTLEQIAGGEISFENGAQALSREFSRLHGSSSIEGALFIFELHTNDPQVRIYSLIKYDYREAIEQKATRGGHTSLRKIIHALIDEKKAIQKSALIRVLDGCAEMGVAVHDRAKPALEIADYFATFLDVERNRSDDDLNRAVVEVLRKTFQESKDILPSNDVARALHHAKGVLRDREEIDQDAVVSAVIAAAGHPDDEEKKALLGHRTRRKLRSHKLEGLVFKPDRSVLRKPPLRKLRTTEGVTVTYPDGAEAITVHRQRRADREGEVITITTDQIVEDELVPDRTR